MSGISRRSNSTDPAKKVYMFSRKFITGSSYEGTTPNIFDMHGFGRYIYPDGSEYVGYFRYGLFNGHGILTLAPPYAFIFRGLWEDGKLTKVDEMVFDDGLRIAATFDGQKLNTDSWTYCSETDRRFLSELYYGMNGLFSKITARQRTRHVPYGNYDTEEGIFGPNARFISRISPPFPEQRYVGCDKERDWIVKNCRRGTEVIYMEDMPKEEDKKGSQQDIEVLRRIVEGNLKAMAILGEKGLDCQCNEAAVRQRNIANICKPATRQWDYRTDCEEVGKSSDISSDIAVTPRSISCAESFSVQSMKKDDLLKKIKTEVDNAQLKELDDNASHLLDFSRIFGFFKIYRAD